MKIYKENIKKIFERIGIEKIDENRYRWVFTDEDIKIWLEHGTMDTDTTAEIENSDNICISVIFNVDKLSSEWTYAECDHLGDAIYEPSDFWADFFALIEIKIKGE